MDSEAYSEICLHCPKNARSEVLILNFFLPFQNGESSKPTSQTRECYSRICVYAILKSNLPVSNLQSLYVDSGRGRQSEKDRESDYRIILIYSRSRLLPITE